MDPTAIDQALLIDQHQSLKRLQKRYSHQDDVALVALAAGALLIIVRFSYNIPGSAALGLVVSLSAAGFLFLTRESHRENAERLKEAERQLEAYGYVLIGDFIHDNAGRPISHTHRG